MAKTSRTAPVSSKKQSVTAPKDRPKPPNAGKGRPKGCTNKVTREIKDIATGLLTDPVYQAELRLRLNTGKAPHMETLLHHYAYGKPKDTVEGTMTHLHKVYGWQEQ